MLCQYIAGELELEQCQRKLHSGLCASTCMCACICGLQMFDILKEIQNLMSAMLQYLQTVSYVRRQCAVLPVYNNSDRRLTLVYQLLLLRHRVSTSLSFSLLTLMSLLIIPLRIYIFLITNRPGSSGRRGSYWRIAASLFCPL